MTFVSYAQNYEDVILYRALRDVEKGFYIDVGAQDPVIDSVTKAFYERGWRGVNLEPVKYWYEKLMADRPEDINLNIAAADREGRVRIFEVVGTGLSTLDPEFARRHAEAGYQVVEQEVPALPLSVILETVGLADIHFLKIDVEGAEASVIRGLDLQRFRPWIILVEAVEPNMPRVSERVAEWEPLLVREGYTFVYFDGLNRFYLANEQLDRQEAFCIPPNFFDNFIRHSEWEAKRQKSHWQAAAASLSRELAGERDRADSLSRELEAATAKIEELSAEVRQWQSLAEELSREVAALRAAPYRRAKALVSAAADKIKAAVNRARVACRRGVGCCLRKGMSFVLAHPSLRSGLKRVITRDPRLQAVALRLLSRLSATGHLPPSGPAVLPGGMAVCNLDDVLIRMPPRAREIYAELKKVMEKRVVETEP